MTLQRRTPLKKKREKPRRVAATCSRLRCKRRPIVGDLCRTHAVKLADQLVGDFVKERDGWRCVECGATPVQWCHLFPKGRYPRIRYEPINAVAWCLKHHTYYDRSPIERDVWMLKRLGESTVRDLRWLALHGPSVDLEAVIRQYGAAVERERTA